MPPMMGVLSLRRVASLLLANVPPVPLPYPKKDVGNGLDRLLRIEVGDPT